MSVPSVVKGQYFDVAVEADPISAPNVYTYLCGLNTRNLTHQINTADDFLRDCGDPEQVPWRVLNANGQQKDMSGTGLHNRAQTSLLRSIFGKTLNYRFIEGEPGVDLVDQGYWQGPFKFINWQEGAADGANVTAQMTFASDGVVPWVVSTPPTLVTLTVAPLTATVNTLWTGTITGRTASSTITATSPGVTITNVGNQLKATFPTTGSKAVTIVESDGDATNSPRTTVVNVTVS